MYLSQLLDQREEVEAIPIPIAITPAVTPDRPVSDKHEYFLVRKCFKCSRERNVH